ncbi:cation:dicarboxylate symporter family transporter [Streptosporangium sp. DT93]|uniref:cation:dicarboxylate symporter family transporter n=1 Tax=Streptosporangium sp. DT93 TaxID=3393428 RepID=UPI003CE8F973
MPRPTSPPPRGAGILLTGERGRPALNGIAHVQRLVFRVLATIMWAAPAGAFGAMAAVVGATGTDALRSLGVVMLAFYLTCLLFVFVLLGPPDVGHQDGAGFDEATLMDDDTPPPATRSDDTALSPA